MNQPHNDMELRNDLGKGSVFLLENVSLKRYYLQVDCTSISEITAVGELILLLQEELHSDMLVFQPPLASQIIHSPREKKQDMLSWRQRFEKHGFLPAVVTGKKRSVD